MESDDKFNFSDYSELNLSNIKELPTNKITVQNTNNKKRNDIKSLFNNLEYRESDNIDNFEYFHSSESEEISDNISGDEDFEISNNIKQNKLNDSAQKKQSEKKNKIIESSSDSEDFVFEENKFDEFNYKCREENFKSNENKIMNDLNTGSNLNKKNEVIDFKKNMLKYEENAFIKNNIPKNNHFEINSNMPIEEELIILPINFSFDETYELMKGICANKYKANKYFGNIIDNTLLKETSEKLNKKMKCFNCLNIYSLSPKRECIYHYDEFDSDECHYRCCNRRFESRGCVKNFHIEKIGSEYVEPSYFFSLLFLVYGNFKLPNKENIFSIKLCKNNGKIKYVNSGVTLKNILIN